MGQKKKSVEPYRMLFPIGILVGLLGASLWMKSGGELSYANTVQAHSHLMIGGFLFSFAAGFLMTAIPKMTASFPARIPEIGVACSLAVTNALFAYSESPRSYYLSVIVSTLFLSAFFLRRFRARQAAVPPFFPFVILGILSGLTGAVLLALAEFNISSNFLAVFGKRLYLEGMILLLVLGIGSRLVPVISGRGAKLEIGAHDIAKNFALGFLLITGFALESAGQLLLGSLLKFAVVSWVAWFNWGLFARADTLSRLAIGMRISGIMVLAGLLMSVVYPAMAVHWMHLTYIGGFSLMTLTVASRVTLAHGSYDLSFEARSRAIWICGILILVSALTRVLAPFVGAGYFSHLMYAAAIWVLAVFIWSSVFLVKMVRRGELAEPKL